MTVSRVTRVSNPRKQKRRTNPRKLTLKQKLHFGSARQRAAAKASLKRRHNPKKRATKARTRTRVVFRTQPARRTNTRKRARRNPAHILTLGFVNPSHRPSGRKSTRRTKNAMPATRKRRRTAKASNPKRRRRNSVKVIVRHRRRANAHRTRRHSNPRRRRMNVRHHRRHNTRRNPVMFGRQMGAVEVTKLIVGGLVGVAATKAIPNMLPTFATSSSLVAMITSGIVAIGGGMLLKALIKSDPTIGDAFMFGGLMQTGSVGLNAFLPSVGTTIGLQGLGNGMGDLVPGGFPVPMNPIMAGQKALPAVHPAVAAAMAKGGHPASAAAAAPAATGVGAIFNPWGRAL